MAPSISEPRSRQTSGAANARRQRRALRSVVVLAVLVRLALLVGNRVAHPDLFFQDTLEISKEISRPDLPYVNGFGFEASNIAYAWACGGQGYASPFGGGTGPTAWIAPGVVSTYAVSFALWGCFTPASILFVFGIALVISAITTVLVFQLGNRIGGEPGIGLLAALLFAVLPYEAWLFWITGHLDFNLQVLSLAVLLLAAIRALERGSSDSGVELGTVSSLAALFNPGLLLCTAAAGLVWLRKRPVRPASRFLLGLAVPHLLITGTYIGVQSARLGDLVPVKSNAGFELYLGNTPETGGLLTTEIFQLYHPSRNAQEFARYQELGEAEYVRAARAKFSETIGFQEFARNSLRRALFYFLAYNPDASDSSQAVSLLKAAMWLIPGLSLVVLVAVRRGRLAEGELVMLLFVFAYALPYMFTGVSERYRIPMATVVAVTLAILAYPWLKRLRSVPTAL